MVEQLNADNRTGCFQLSRDFNVVGRWFKPAAGVIVGDNDYAEEFLQQEIVDSFDPLACNVAEILAGTYQLDPGDIEAMRAVVDSWKAKKTAFA